MILGDPNIFALESEIEQAYERNSLRALGFFAIYISGQRFGVRKRDATMLATVFDGVAERIRRRGLHMIGGTANAGAQEIAIAFIRAEYIDHDRNELFFGMRDSDFLKLLYTNDIVWAPDGDETFDDGSVVLQFDIGDMARLVSFNSGGGRLIDPDSLRDLYITQESFYEILQEWHKGFEREWRSLPKQLV